MPVYFLSVSKQYHTIPCHGIRWHCIIWHQITSWQFCYIKFQYITYHKAKLSSFITGGVFPEIDCLQCLQALCHFACSVSVCLGDLNVWGRDFKTIQPYCLHIPLLMAEIQLTTWDVRNPIINDIYHINWCSPDFWTINCTMSLYLTIAARFSMFQMVRPITSINRLTERKTNNTLPQV